MSQDAYGNYIVTVDQPAYTPGASSGGGSSGIGAPDNADGNNGDTYTDLSSGDFYIKYNDVWNIFQGAPGGSGESGVGSPEGVVSAASGTTYLDTASNNFWVKATGVGNTGWVAIVT